MSLGLSAPAAVTVEVRTAERRVFRLSQEIGMGGLRLERPAPFEPGRPVEVSFSLPGSTVPIALHCEVVATGDPAEQDGDRGGAALHYLDPPPEVRAEITSYVVERLGLPPLP